MKNNIGLLGVFLSVLLLSIGSAQADATTDRLNFFNAEQHTVNITNTLTASADAVSTMPAGFSFVSSTTGCTNPSGQTVTCNTIGSGSDAEYIISSPGTGTEYALYTLNSTLNGTAINDVDFIYIQDDEIFNTLVEYGRGRGNYFYNTMDSGTASSAGMGTGYPYVPVNESFELNYLHKVFNVKQYYGLASSRATDVSFSCTYPYHTVVRSHLTESITDDGSDWTVLYSLPRIDGSWERMGFLGQDFDSGEYTIGQSFTINCTNLQYTLADAYGDMVVSEDAFTMTVRNSDALAVTASSGTATIGNGTSEVEITYTFNNTEVYPLDKVVIEVDAPEGAQFIGTRGELWGSAQDKFRYELTTMASGQYEELVLVARFDTSALTDTTLLLTQGVKAQYFPTWQVNAYNPLSYVQSVSVADTQSVNYGTSSAITSIQTQLTAIQTNTEAINTTVNQINSTVNLINSTTTTTSSNLLAINTSLFNAITAINSSLSAQITDTYTNLTTDISSLSSQVTAFESNMQALVNCTSSPSAPLCSYASDINTSVTNLETSLLAINTSLFNTITSVNSTLYTELNNGFNTVYANFTYTNALINTINASLSSEISNINVTSTTNLTEVLANIQELNVTTQSIQSDLLAVNATLIGINSSLSSEMTTNTNTIINAITGVTANISSVLTEISYLQSFNEELVFLVTDSVGLANEGKQAFINGEPEVAMAKLEESQARLITAQEIMAKEEKPLENRVRMENANVVMKVFYKIRGLFL